MYVLPTLLASEQGDDNRGYDMSIFDKVKEMFHSHEDKLKNIPEQPKSSAGDTAADTTQDTGGMMGGLREKAEDAAMPGIDTASEKAKGATGGKFDDQINQATDKAKGAADKIDGQEG